MEKEKLEISNSKEDAVDGKWENPGSSLLKKLDSYSNSWELRKEAYLIADKSSVTVSEHKYPHHVIKGNKLVLHTKGVKAAYSRAKQSGVFSGALKSHLERHYRELGLYKDSTMNEEALLKIKQNFDDIKVLLESMEDKNVDLKPVYILARNIDPLKARGKVLPVQQAHSVNFATTLKVLTGGDNYSHSGISFDDSFKEIYSFNSVTKTGGGFIAEKIDGIQWFSHSVYVAVAFIPEESLNKLKQKVKEFSTKDLTKTKYQFSHLLRMMADKTKNQDYRFICSTFVGYLLFLADPKFNSKSFNSIRPEDMTLLPRTFYVMNIQYDKWEGETSLKNEFKERVKKIYNDHKTELADYNNHLPKLMIQKEFSKTTSFDDFVQKVIGKFYRNAGV